MEENMQIQRKKRTQRDYTLAFKLQVIAEVERRELTNKQAPKKYGVQGKSTVLVWLRKYDADRMPIGIYIREKETFTKHIVQLQTSSPMDLLINLVDLKALK